MIWPKIRYPIYDRCSWHSCPKHNLWRAFVGVIDIDEKVASLKERTQFKTRVQKPHFIYDQNGQNRYPTEDQNGWKTIPFGAARTNIAHIRKYSPFGVAERGTRKYPALLSSPSDSKSRDFTANTCNVNMTLLADCNMIDCSECKFSFQMFSYVILLCGSWKLCE